MPIVFAIPVYASYEKILVPLYQIFSTAAEQALGVVERTDVEAALEARRELGPEYVDAVVDRIEKRLDERLRTREPSAELVRQGSATPRILGSIALGIPVTAVAPRFPPARSRDAFARVAATGLRLL